MTVLSLDPHSHRAACTRRDDPEPRVEELLNDPVLLLLMARDGIDRATLERALEDARQRLAQQAATLFEAILYAECRAA